MTKGRKTPARESWLDRLSLSVLPFVGSWLLRLLESSLRWRMDPASAERVRAMQQPGGAPVIFALWHNRILVIPSAWERHLLRWRKQAFVLTSASKDGEWLARFVARFSLGAVRGSARRRGPEALRELLGVLKNGHDVVVTPDGSKGPRYVLKGGTALLAQLSGCPIVPVSVEFSRCWRLRSWDAFMIPKPFSRVDLFVGEPHTVPITRTEEEFEAARARCEAALSSLLRVQ